MKTLEKPTSGQIKGMMIIFIMLANLFKDNKIGATVNTVLVLDWSFAIAIVLSLAGAILLIGGKKIEKTTITNMAGYACQAWGIFMLLIIGAFFSGPIGQTPISAAHAFLIALLVMGVPGILYTVSPYNKSE